MRSWRPRGFAGLLAVVILAGAPTGCNDPVAPEITDLARAMDRWESRGPRDYSFDYQVSCFCPLPETQPLRIEVRDRDVTRAVPAGSHEELGEKALDEIPTIDDLFEWILDAIDAEAHRIDAIYDDQLGYPRDVFIDRADRAIDDELSFEVSNFQALSAR